MEADWIRINKQLLLSKYGHISIHVCKVSHNTTCLFPKYQISLQLMQHFTLVTYSKRVMVNVNVFQTANVKFNNAETESGFAVCRKFLIFQQPCLMQGTEIGCV